MRGLSNVACKVMPVRESIKGKVTKEKPVKARSKKAEKDPNMPKKPATAFFVFMAEFRKTTALKGPAAAKAGGEKWKSLTDKEKKPYVDGAAEQKAAYSKALAAYEQQKGEASNESSMTGESNEESDNVNVVELEV